MEQPRRVVAKLDWHRRELLPKGRFIITNLNLPSEGVVHFYNGRGTAEQWTKETEYALKWTRLSCHWVAANQVQALLFILAYNLGHFMPDYVYPTWSNTGRREDSRLG